MSRLDEIKNSYRTISNSPNIRDDVGFRIMWILQDISETLARMLDAMEGEDEES